MTVAFPEGTPVLDTMKVAIVDTIADLEAPDISTEIKAATSLDISCFVRDFLTPETTNTGSAPNRMCTGATLPQEGRTQIEPIAIAYVYDPQAADTTLENKVKAKLAQGEEFLAVIRKGIPFDVDWAADDKVEVVKVRCGRQRRGVSDGDDFAEYEIQQNLLPKTVNRTDGILVA